MDVFAGQGDAARTMALLWDAPQRPGTGRRTPGPRPGLSADAIVEAAVAVADAGTGTGLSMRAVAERLGCSAMALYTYVPGKDELLDLMYDRVHAELPAGHEPGAGWRAAAASWAGELRALYLRHPWVLRVSRARPVLGPHEQTVLETLLGILDGAGLPAGTRQGVVGLLFDFVRGSAQTVADARNAAAATGTSDQEWWSARSAVLREVAPDFAERFPLSVRLGQETAAARKEAAARGEAAPRGEAPPRKGDAAPYLEQEADAAFAAGLAVVLDGIGASAASLPRSPGTPDG
ncbi:TetR family transcriptional regulator [Streptomyces sp. SCUT-3]|uniref:TetR/AcrR family transcriptional regulator n=1 Tax=Streptomyces sp. SCUT-3 TaxID=2684469 RepID=UPI000CC01D6E|nr:TetR/AcrR family transcriptional regulator [Streptomyces sp. SCUT-3]PLW71324.1 TetR family transcriptional regulator [Streptomyces sp. DJ]QMV20836.1 TetR family transcriptional regulator [Streptomyces sp. SCUT-3]